MQALDLFIQEAISLCQPKDVHVCDGSELPFCGYHMGDYFAHWIDIGKKLDPQLMPRIFHVNWFRKNFQGHFLWPGFRHNSYVLRWIFERVSNAVEAQPSPVGFLPPSGMFELAELFDIDKEGYLQEAAELEQYFSLFGSKFPPELHQEFEDLKKRCGL